MCCRDAGEGLQRVCRRLKELRERRRLFCCRRRGRQQLHRRAQRAGRKLRAGKVGVVSRQHPSQLQLRRRLLLRRVGPPAAAAGGALPRRQPQDAVLCTCAQGQRWLATLS